MEEYLGKAVELISSADIYILTAVAVLTALIPFFKWTENKTDDKYSAKALEILKKIASFLPSKKAK